MEYIVNEQGKRISVVLSIKEYETLVEAREELADIAEYDEALEALEDRRETRTLRRERGE